MKVITCSAIRDHKPCYDPTRHLPEDYSGSVVDFLRQEQIPAADRIWVAKYFVTDKTNRLFAVWCARQALALVSNPDPRSIAACDVAERLANGEATEAELSAAREAAWSAVREAAAWSAAEAAARAAAAADAWTRAAADAWARAAARAAQINHLITLVERDEP